MGANGSKASRAIPKRYPTKSPIAPSTIHKAPDKPLTSNRPSMRPSPSDSQTPLASTSRDQTINRDSYDPQLGSQLRHLGAVHAAPTLSHSSIAGSAEHPTSRPELNPAIQLLRARETLAQQAEQEFNSIGRRGFEGRQHLDAVTIRQAISLRDEKHMKAANIEKELGLRAGVISRLGGDIVQNV